MLPAADVEYLLNRVRGRTAIALDAGKGYLLESRLRPLARHHADGSLPALVGRVRGCPDGELARSVLEAITTDETSFFRDGPPFEALAGEILPGLLARRAGERRLRLWSAGCSTGQEAYSLALLLADRFPALIGWDVLIHATDFSREMVARAGAGWYSGLEAGRGLPDSLRDRYFEPDGAGWRAGPALRRLVRAAGLNLAEPWPSLPLFDVILLRNVLIDFDAATARLVLARARRVLRPDGVLLLGSAEMAALDDAGWERFPVGGSAALRPRADGAPVVEVPA
jgi:chemotaxis protein methyltransferase CheR